VISLTLNTLLPELKKHVQDSDASMASVIATTREKGGVDAAALAKNWGISSKGNDTSSKLNHTLPHPIWVKVECES
jgi:hypothetical protein